ncbi:MAG: hypothetical protein R2778_19350 [Saprospiraceae bacterium]
MDAMELLQTHDKCLEQDCKFYEEKIKEAREEAEDFERTKKEKYAREHCCMKRSNEDVYIIQEEGK